MEPEEGFITGRVLPGGECSLCVSLTCGPHSAGHGPTRSSVRSDPGFSCYDPDGSSFLFIFLDLLETSRPLPDLLPWRRGGGALPASP
jgi:hypothetical protein